MSKQSKRDTNEDEGPTGVCIGPQVSHRGGEQGLVLLLNLGGRSQALRASNDLLLLERAAVTHTKSRRAGVSQSSKLKEREVASREDELGSHDRQNARGDHSRADICVHIAGEVDCPDRRTGMTSGREFVARDEVTEVGDVGAVKRASARRVETHDFV